MVSEIAAESCGGEDQLSLDVAPAARIHVEIARIVNSSQRGPRAGEPHSRVQRIVDLGGALRIDIQSHTGVDIAITRPDVHRFTYAPQGFEHRYRAGLLDRESNSLVSSHPAD